MSLQQLTAFSQPQVIELRDAERKVNGETTTVALPDRLVAHRSDTSPQQASYRLVLRLPVPAPEHLSIYIPGLAAHTRIRFNGELVDDRQSQPRAPLPRSIDRIRLIDVPAAFVPFDGPLLDAVSVTAVPEPETWALMLGGLGTLLISRRRTARLPR